MDLELDIVDLADSGEGVGRWDGKVVFVPDTVPGDRVRVLVRQNKHQFIRADLAAILHPSDDRIRPACIVADKCGGCQWQTVAYAAQLAAKQNQVAQALRRLGQFPPEQVEVLLSPIIPAPEPLGYRNKSTYPVATGSHRNQVRAGYYQRGTHKLVNLNRCPVQDERLDPLLAQVKRDIGDRGWSAYEEIPHRGQVRHLGLRIGRGTGEILLTLVVTTWDLPGIEAQAAAWQEEFEDVVGVCLNLNPARGNRVFGTETRCVAGRGWLRERLGGVELAIGSETFFQVNTEQTAQAIALIRSHLGLTGRETAIDAYCGVGTLILPLARDLQRAIGLEIQPESVHWATANARRNGLTQVKFRVATVETGLAQAAADLGGRPDLVLLDPPRKGCDPAVIEALRAIGADRMVYMSCQPATLARDLALLCAEGAYDLERVQPLDFFPQTPHVECLAFLRRAVSPSADLDLATISG